MWEGGPRLPLIERVPGLYITHVRIQFCCVWEVVGPLLFFYFAPGNYWKH